MGWIGMDLQVGWGIEHFTVLLISLLLKKFDELQLYHWLPLDIVLHACPAVHKLTETRQVRQPGSETEL